MVSRLPSHSIGIVYLDVIFRRVAGGPIQMTSADEHGLRLPGVRAPIMTLLSVKVRQAG